MNNNKTMSREEIMEAIQEGDRYAGVLMEEMNDKFDTIMEVYDLLDNKIDRVDTKVDNFQKETSQNFNLLFEELHAIRDKISG